LRKSGELFETLPKHPNFRLSLENWKELWTIAIGKSR
jgi:hypothetical protein